MSDSDKAQRIVVVANLHYGGDYREQLRRAQQTGDCIFCGNPIQKEGVLFESSDWLLRENRFPTKDAEDEMPAHHFLIISKRHRENDCIAIDPDDWVQIASLIHQTRVAFGIVGGGLVHRIGEPVWSGATILHCHIHFIVPRVLFTEGVPRTIPVYMPIG